MIAVSYTHLRAHETEAERVVIFGFGVSACNNYLPENQLIDNDEDVDDDQRN